MKNIIYGLRDPRNDVYCYIGKSTVGKKRSISHLLHSHSEKVNEWVISLSENWNYPKIDIIEEVDDVNDLSEREKYWISYYNNINPDLLNIQNLNPHPDDIRTKDDDSEFNNLLRLVYKIPEILQRERIVRGLSQSGMAEELGVSRSTISLLERGSNVSFDTVQRYALQLKGHDLVYNYNRRRA
jgi:DNA-binding XRE family transcriptional regulator